MESINLDCTAVLLMVIVWQWDYSFTSVIPWAVLLVYQKRVKLIIEKNAGHANQSEMPPDPSIEQQGAMLQYLSPLLWKEFGLHSQISPMHNKLAMLVYRFKDSRIWNELGEFSTTNGRMIFLLGHSFVKVHKDWNTKEHRFTTSGCINDEDILKIQDFGMQIS
ncbi:hypothetical protein BT96DRAFT_935792 [Gymnopus androsaceus JB14]|uniref:Uncharacterized protein n=1 Tax=Gymnopus androsaceus JB14 TaxID=1447944 RepID=A0A6A4I635_9AGAR|nr:hypothetical protein BT96DRAFT_935792 [Gymnopus androsaceus JB14]